MSFMEKLIIFYDDTRPSCCRCISRFEGKENVECRKASEYLEKSLFFATNARIGLVFESDDGKVPYVISHVIWRMNADKTKDHMILVTGGRREFKAIETARNDMEKRGYHVRNIYIRYMLEKYKLKEEDVAGWVLHDMETDQLKSDVKEKYKDMSRREVAKHLRKEFRQYRKYQKDRNRDQKEKQGE